MPFTKGHKPYLTTHSEESKQKMRLGRLGEKNPMFGKEAWNKGIVHLPNEKNPAWKGNKVTKLSIHAWVRKHFPKTGICEHCKSSMKTEWSNKDHKYDSRERSSWQELCRSCHQFYDYNNLGRTRTRRKLQSQEKVVAIPASGKL